MTTQELLIKAKAAKSKLGSIKAADIDRALLMMADQLIENTDAILAANALDVEAAKGNISDVMIDRLMLSAERISGMAQGIREVAALPSPLGRVLKHHERPDGLVIERVSVALGVVAIIYESRPNVTSDAAALALKSGNVCVLRCGKEAHGSAAAIVKALRAGLKKAGLDEDMVLLIEDTTRQSANELMTADGYVDLLIPRGGKGLISAIDLDMALDIVENAKCSRPSVCNAEEVLVVAESVAQDFLPRLKQRLVDEREVNPVELRLDEKAAQIIDGTPAGEQDFDTEFLDYILAVKIVKDVNEAVAHINAHSTGHSEAIITQDEQAADIFTRGIDSSSVYVNRWDSRSSTPINTLSKEVATSDERELRYQRAPTARSYPCRARDQLPFRLYRRRQHGRRAGTGGVALNQADHFVRSRRAEGG